MLWLSLLALVLLAAVVAAMLGRWEGAAVPETDDAAEGRSDVDELLRRRAQTEITSADLEELRFDSAIRGYRMDQVDRLLDALEAQLRTAQALAADREDQEVGGQGLRRPGTESPERAHGADAGSVELPARTSDMGESPSPEGESDPGFHRAE